MNGHDFDDLLRMNVLATAALLRAFWLWQLETFYGVRFKR